jgi:hypothetical protein
VREPQDAPAVARSLDRHPFADAAEAGEIVMRDQAHVERERAVGGGGARVAQGLHLSSFPQ